MNERRVILSLIAMGRITPAQAERLLAVANERDEIVLALAACLAGLFMMQVHLHELVPGILLFFKSLPQGIAAAAHQTLHLVNELLGGIQ
jgi:hypothetical protein